MNESAFELVLIRKLLDHRGLVHHQLDKPLSETFWDDLAIWWLSHQHLGIPTRDTDW
jgi:hypothetical protein